MADARDFLVEIGTEELPPKALKRLRDAFRDGLVAKLDELQLDYGAVAAFASPRRLAVRVEALAARQPDRETRRRGPALAAAFDADGRPTKAAEGFARSCGVDVGQLQREESDKGAWLCHRSIDSGKPAAELVPLAVQAALDGLPIPKRMRWGDGSAEFVRPVHWVVLLFGNAVIDAEILGVASGGTTRGHRFHAPEPIEIPAPADYERLLREQGHVLVDWDERRQRVREQVIAAAGRLGGDAQIDEALLDEVTALNEWPTALSGRFEERFLEVPSEVLIETMQGHQKYFPVVDRDGGLLPHFITLCNIESRDPQAVRAGNERVIRPRFADAAFFWQQDRRHPLGDRIESLRGVVFQERLGSLFDKAQRIGALAAAHAAAFATDRARATRAAELCKCDLMSDLVGEFPSLQGTMGRYYAQAGGEPDEIAAAIEEHYFPRQAGGRLPQTATGRALAVADRIDTLVGIFAIGQRPTGVKDPFGLRRAALGVLRILIETPLELDLRQLLTDAAANLPATLGAAAVVDEVLDYMLERLKGYYADRGLRADAIDAVLARGVTAPADFDRRVRAVERFRELPQAASLAAANKRIRNILRKADQPVPEAVARELLCDPAEVSLADALEQARAATAPLAAARRYADHLSTLAGLREPVDAFFDKVMVMDQEPSIRGNRLALLGRLEALFLEVADIGRLQ